MRKSPFGREEFGSWGWHILIVFTLYKDCPSIHTTFSKCKKLQECEIHIIKRMVRRENIHLPTTENIFWRFWWEWSSGKFSATTVRDYNKKINTLHYATIRRNLVIIHEHKNKPSCCFTCNSSFSFSVKGCLRLTFLPSALKTYKPLRC
jgi:hypothetical protein